MQHLKPGKIYRIRVGIQTMTMQCILSSKNNAVLRSLNDERTISINPEGEVVADSTDTRAGISVQVLGAED